jgi:ABC-2 type transport system permease protein
VRTTAFRVSTVLSVVIVVALVLMPDGGDEAKVVGLAGRSSPRIAGLLRASGEQLDVPLETRRFPTEAAGRAALRSEDAAVLLVDQEVLVWKADVDGSLEGAVTAAVQAAARRDTIAELGLTPPEVEELLRPPSLGSESIEGFSRDRQARQELATIALALLFVAIAFYGGFLLVGVVQEKSSRVVEVLLSRLRATELLSGKILGIGLVGLAQVMLVAAAGLAAMTFAGRAELPDTTAGTIGWIVCWFVLGYGFYAVIYATVGSLVSRQEEAETVQFPITALLLVAYVLSMEAVRSPDGVAAIVGSFLPPTAPMLMIVRIAEGGVPWWQIVLSASLMVLSIAALVSFAARVYAGAVLRVGRRVRLREAWRGAAS